MRSQSPAESCHVMDADTLTRADIHLTGIRENGQLLAIGGLSILSATEGELKSMHTAQEARGGGWDACCSMRCWIMPGPGA